VSDAADRARVAAWERLDRVARSAATALGDWRHRALQAEAEVARLRTELEALSALGPLPSAEPVDELRRLRAENAVLSSKVDQARERIRRLLATLGVLEGRR
jgi:uncharacterized membrane protein